MREIKFRAWDTEYKRWENPDGIGLDDGVPFSSTGDGYVDDVYTHYPEYVVQQFTGLTDRHGVEIYEGDILERPTYLQNSVDTEIGPVYYTNRGTWDWYSYLLGDKNERATVIGNIYENPELLNEK